MSKDIFGVGTCAKKCGSTKDKIRRLVYIKKIKPKKISVGGMWFYKFSPKDQETIQAYTDFKGK